MLNLDDFTIECQDSQKIFIDVTKRVNFFASVNIIVRQDIANNKKENSCKHYRQGREKVCHSPLCVCLCVYILTSYRYKTNKQLTIGIKLQYS